MLSRDAIESFDHLFEHAIHDNSVSADDVLTQMTRQQERRIAADGESRRLVVLNISSYVFRVVALFDFATDEVTRAHLAKILRCPRSQMEGQGLEDAYAELVNMICGAVHRGLSSAFSHGGMSTPLMLENTCERYVSLLNPSWTQSYAVEINQTVRFNLMACVCVAKGLTLDFALDRSLAQEESAGELELF